MYAINPPISISKGKARDQGCCRVTFDMNLHEGAYVRTDGKSREKQFLFWFDGLPNLLSNRLRSRDFRRRAGAPL